MKVKIAASFIIFLVLFMAFWHINNGDNIKRVQTRPTDSADIVLPISVERSGPAASPIFKPRQYIQIGPK